MNGFLCVITSLMCSAAHQYVNVTPAGRFIVPIVDMNVELNASSENRNNMHVLPTPESPISNSLNK